MSAAGSGARPRGMRAPRFPCVPVIALYKKLALALPGLITAPVSTPPAATEPPFIAPWYVSRFSPARDCWMWQGVQLAAKIVCTSVHVGCAIAPTGALALEGG